MLLSMSYRYKKEESPEATLGELTICFFTSFEIAVCSIYRRLSESQFSPHYVSRLLMVCSVSCHILEIFIKLLGGIKKSGFASRITNNRSWEDRWICKFLYFPCSYRTWLYILYKNCLRSSVH